MLVEIGRFTTLVETYSYDLLAGIYQVKITRRQNIRFPLGSFSTYSKETLPIVQEISPANLYSFATVQLIQMSKNPVPCCTIFSYNRTNYRENITVLRTPDFPRLIQEQLPRNAWNSRSRRNYLRSPLNINFSCSSTIIFRFFFYHEKERRGNILRLGEIK